MFLSKKIMTANQNRTKTLTGGEVMNEGERMKRAGLVPSAYGSRQSV